MRYESNKELKFTNGLKKSFPVFFLPQTHLGELDIGDIIIYAYPNITIFVSFFTELVKSPNHSQIILQNPNEKYIDNQYFFEFKIFFRPCLPGELKISSDSQ